jgi:hypothetical protein
VGRYKRWFVGIILQCNDVSYRFSNVRNQIIEDEVLTVVTMKSTMFWDVMWWSLSKMSVSSTRLHNLKFQKTLLSNCRKIKYMGKSISKFQMDIELKQIRVLI